MVQHPTGFTIVDECITQGAPATFLYKEEDTKQFVITLDNGVVVNEGGIVTRNGKILKDTETYREDQQRLLKKNRDISQENPLYFDGRLAVISSPGQENWYHWLLQVLPRIQILRDSGVQFDKIYINNLQFGWQKSALDLVLKHAHIQSDKLYLIQGDAIVEASQLIVPSVAFKPSQVQAFPRWLKEYLRSVFLVDIDPGSMPERIYISRAKAKLRRVTNEDELIYFLQQKGFVVVNLEDETPYRQAQLFHHAKIVIGPHGSGFANLVFAEPGTSLIEIDHGLAADQRSCFKPLAQAMQCHYHAYFADLVSEEDLEKDITVNMSDFTDYCKWL